MGGMRSPEAIAEARRYGMVIAVIVGLVVAAVGLLVLRARIGTTSSLATDPGTRSRDNADPARAIDQLRSQGNGAL
ncbi:hypothetical protein [Actinoallomurus sp. CA-150999]|uniref:hypothetical protein n=1 Tax=Actinoallomurus sp. CA-150999 TaxID=3239887 RepID=UPI003D950A97